MQSSCGDFRSTCGLKIWNRLRNGGEIIGGAVALRFLHENRLLLLLHPGRPVLAPILRWRAGFDAVLARLKAAQVPNGLVSHVRMEPRGSSPRFRKRIPRHSPCSDFFLKPETRAVGSAFVRVRASPRK